MTTSELQLAFFASLGVTVVILGAAIALAKLHRAKAHIGGIVAFLASFVVTLGLAEALGRRYEFEAISQRIHLTLAVATTAFAAVPLITGVQHYRGKLSLRLHGRMAGVFLVGVLLTLGTGLWMLSRGQPRPETAAREE